MVKSLGEFNISLSSSADIHNITWSQRNPRDTDIPKKYPDIVITRMKEKKPKRNTAGILIELKETKNFENGVAKDEIEKLVEMMDDYDSSGTLLYACLDSRKGKKVKQTNKTMEEMIPKGWERWMSVKTINIKGKKTYDADMDYFDEKVKILRKYRG